MRRDTLIAALLEAGLLTLAAGLGWAFHSPLVFTSLGPTAYEMVETPTRPSAKPYNVLVGHGVAIVAGLLALLISHAWSVPSVSVNGVPSLRIVSVALAGLLTVIGTLMLKAAQPASLSTTLLIALGTQQSGKNVLCIIVGVLVILAAGEPVRRWRVRTL